MMEVILQHDPTGGFVVGAAGVVAFFAFILLVLTRPWMGFGLGLTAFLGWIAVLPWVVGSVDTSSKVAFATLWSGVSGILTVLSGFATFED